MTAAAATGMQFENPFLGLRSFTSDESYLYFGREGQSDELLRKMDRSHFLAILGVSGSGKSSLVRAGLLPSLYSGYLARAGADWHIADFRPGGDPIGNLAAALSRTGLVGNTLDAELLRSSSLAIVSTLKQARESGAWPEGENLLVLADQFEELFRFQVRQESSMADRDEKAAFVKLLLEAGRQQELPIYVVITMRSDFLGDCSHFRDLPEAINNGQYLIPQMTRDQRRAAIESPVKVAGATIAPRLVQRILNDIGEDPGQLPIMQHALMRTFDHWCERGATAEPLDVIDYEAIGTLSDALSAHADEALEDAGRSLPGRGVEVTKRIFQRLRERDANGREIRKPTPVAELAAIAEATPDEILALLECFRREKRSFVMPPMDVRLTGDTPVDITHESLLRRWKRMTEWVAEELESRRIYVRLADRADEQEHTEFSDFLRGTHLQVALEWWERRRPNREWAERYHAGFEAAERFLRASEENSQRERLQQEQARQAEEQRKLDEAQRIQREREETLRRAAADQAHELRHRSAVRLTMVACTAAVVVIALAVAVVWKVRQQKIDAQVQLLAFQANDTRAVAENLSVWLGLEGVSLRDPVVPHAEQALHRAILVDARESLRLTPGDRSPALRSVGFSHDGRQLMVAGDQGYASVWDLSGTKPPEPVEDLSSSMPGWQTVAAMTADETILAFNRQAEADVCASGREPGRVRVRPAGAHAATTFVLDRDYASFTVSVDGQWFATGGPDQRIAVWDARSGLLMRTLDGSTGPVTALAFSPNGRFLAVASGDRTEERPRGIENRIVLWDLTDGRAERQIGQGHQIGQILALAFSPDGDMLVAGRQDWVASVWRLSGRIRDTEAAILRGHSDDVVHVAFSADGSRLSTASLDNTVRVWDAGTLEPVSSIAAHVKPATSAAFSEDGTRLATSSLDGTVKIWDLISEEELVSTPGFRVPLRGVAFTPDGKQLVAGDLDGMVKVWDVENRWERSLASHGAQLYGVAVSPDGNTIASVGSETVRIWDTATLTEKRQFVRPPWRHVFDNVSFSADGDLVATGGLQGPQLYSIGTGAASKVKWADTGQIRCVAFAPGPGRILAAGGGVDSAIRIFSAETGKLLQKLHPPVSETDSVYSLAFSPDGKYMASGHLDGRIVLWQWNGHSATLRHTMAGHSSWVLTAAFSSDSTRLATGGVDKTIRVWDAESGGELFTITAHTDRVVSLAYGSGRTWLASAGRDGFLRLHPDGTKQLLTTGRSRLYGHPLKEQCRHYLSAVGAESDCDFMVAASAALAEANLAARRGDLAKAAVLYSEARNPRLRLSAEEEARGAARSSAVFEARKLARTGRIKAAADLLSAAGVQVPLSAIERLNRLRLDSELFEKLQRDGLERQSEISREESAAKRKVPAAR